MTEGMAVQITDESHHWYPAIVVVDEVKKWGVQAYGHVLNNDEGPCSVAFIRLNHDQIEPIGIAPIRTE